MSEYVVLETVREDGKVYEIRKTVDAENHTCITKVDVTPEPVVPAPPPEPKPDKQDAMLSLLAQIAGVVDDKDITTHIHTVSEVKV